MLSHFVAGIIKIILLEASIALLVVDRLAGTQWERGRLWAARILAFAMVLAWCNFGALRGNFSLIHHWEQFHFVVGAKYQTEVGWFDLYKAAIIADRESTHLLDNMQQTRDIATFEVIPLDRALADAPRVRARFSDARWAEFKDDWRKLVAIQPWGWDRVLMDHGNSNSPAWALIAHPIAELVPITPAGMTFVGLIDMILMGILWWFVFKTFGQRPALIALVVWAAMPIVFDYLAGSFLRWDWIFCLGMAMCFMKRGQWAIAGGFFGFAVATKLFPLYFGVCLGIRALFVIRKEKVIPVRYKRFAVGTAATGIAAVLLSAAMFGGFWVWKDYKARIDVAREEKFYSIQYSLQTVYLQWSNMTADEYAKGGMLFPQNKLKQDSPEVDVKQQAAGFFLAKLLFTLLVVLLLVRADDLQAFTLGPLLVFTWLIVNMYYWNMFGLLALGLFLRAGPSDPKGRPALGALIGLQAIFGFYYLHQHLNRGYTEGYAMGVLIAAGIVAFAAFEAVALACPWCGAFNWAQTPGCAHCDGKQSPRTDALRASTQKLGSLMLLGAIPIAIEPMLGPLATQGRYAELIAICVFLVGPIAGLAGLQRLTRSLWPAILALAYCGGMMAFGYGRFWGWAIAIVIIGRSIGPVLAAKRAFDPPAAPTPSAPPAAR